MKKTMTTDVCGSCVYVKWMIGIGQGVRCTHPHNQQYKSNDIVFITYVPADCKYYERKDSNDKR